MKNGLVLKLLVAFTLAWCGNIGFAQAQEEEYVDAPVNQQAQAAGGAANAGAASTYVDQFSTGLINYGLTESVYEQFTGNSIFEGGKFPDSFFTNIGWNHFMPLDFKYVPGYSFGAELQYYSATSEDIYSGDAAVVVGPAVNMELFLLSGFVKAFFMDPLKEFLNPFFGFGWGFVTGSIDTTKVGGSKSSTAMFGVQSYRTFGTQLRLSERGGMLMELRTVTARAATSNDPFSLTGEDSVDLDFSGVQVILSGYFRF